MVIGYSFFYYLEFHKAVVFLQHTGFYLPCRFCKNIPMMIFVNYFLMRVIKNKVEFKCFVFNKLLFLNFSQNGLKQYCFLVFLVICCLVATYIFFVVPETKNKTFLEIQSEFYSKKKLIAANGTEGPLLSTPM